MISPRVTLKLAYGFRSIQMHINLNWNVDMTLNKMNDEIRNCFQILPSERVEIVLDRGLPYSELADAIPSAHMSMFHYIHNQIQVVGEYHCTFYARVFRDVGNISYLKSDTNIVTNQQMISFMKKEELEEMRRGVRFHITVLSEADLTLPVVQAPPAPEICSICNENPVHMEHRYNCIHLFCQGCVTRWNHRCALCRQSSI